MDVIRNRSKQWEKEYMIKNVLKDIQSIVRLREDLNHPSLFSNIVDFVFAQFPVCEGSVVHGDLIDEWDEFEESLPNLSLDELYARVMRPCNYKEENT